MGVFADVCVGGIAWCRMAGSVTLSYDKHSVNTTSGGKCVNRGGRTPSESVHNLPDTNRSASSTPKARMSCWVFGLRPEHILHWEIIREIGEWRGGGTGKILGLGILGENRNSRQHPILCRSVAMPPAYITDATEPSV